jgi:hypothetical protein
MHACLIYRQYELIYHILKERRILSYNELVILDASIFGADIIVLFNIFVFFEILFFLFLIYYFDIVIFPILIEHSLSSTVA